MLLHRYLEEILGNKPAISMLRTMIRRKGMVFTVRRLAEEADVSHNESATTVQHLAKFGIIEVQPVGRAYHLKLNEKNYILNKIIKPIFDAEQSTISQLIQTLKKHLDDRKIISAVLFGSVAKKEEKLGSDIDLLIISDDFDHAISLVSEASTEVFEVFRGSISHIVFSSKEFKAKKAGDLIRSIRSNYTLICGRELSGI